MTPSMFSFVPEFQFIRYGKVKDIMTIAFERKAYYLQFPREESHHAMQGHMG